MRVLFVCSGNLKRSRTAAEFFKGLFDTRFYGLSNENNIDKRIVSWAEMIFVMEQHQRDILVKKFPKLEYEKRILNLDIPDVYPYDDPELKELLEVRIDETLNLL